MYPAGSNVRYLYMHRFGGVYSDLDAECLKPMDSLLFPSNGSFPNKREIVLAYMGHDRRFRHGVPNAFLAASSPGHPFWIFLVKRIMKEYTDWANALLPQIPRRPALLTVSSCYSIC